MGEQFEILCEWGEQGVLTMSSRADVIVVVDVLSFSTSVAIAVARGASIVPCRCGDSEAGALARSTGAELAAPRGESRYSLSPVSYLDVPRGTRVVLPSPNGATLSVAAGDLPTLTGSFRNAAATARAAAAIGRRVAIVPAGERWPDGSLRPALEDWLGAGAIAAACDGGLSPEAQAAADAFVAAEPALLERISDSQSGRELIELAYVRDVELACEVDVSVCVPEIKGGAYVARASERQPSVL